MVSDAARQAIEVIGGRDLDVNIGGGSVPNGWTADPGGTGDFLTYTVAPA